jgi:hypothetical protein
MAMGGGQSAEVIVMTVSKHCPCFP